MSDNKEFYDLLNSIVDEQTFSLTLCPGKDIETVKCKQLSTAQLKELIKTVVDSPLTQAAFNSVATKIFQSSLVESHSHSFNVIDRLLFLLETRIQSISSNITMINNDGDQVVIDINLVKQNICQSVKENIECFLPQTISNEKMSVIVDVPDLITESQLNDEIYSNLDLDVDDSEQIRSFIGDAFVNEIAKHLKQIELKDAEHSLDLSSVSFEERIKIVQTLPASLIQDVVAYIEKQTRILEDCLVVDGFYLGIDSTFFTLR